MHALIAQDTSREEHITCDVVSAGIRLPIDAAGTGVLQAVQILAYINLYSPKLLILDEPDAHLHPNNQRRLARLVAELAESRDFQVIISTHSRHLLDELSDDAKKHWIRGGKRVDDAEYDDVAVLIDVGALDRGDRLRSGCIETVVLTEDEHYEPIRELLLASGARLETIEFWAYRGASNKDTVAALAKVVRRHAPGTRLIVHRDRDYLTDEEVLKYREDITSICPDTIVFVTDGTDAESHFLKTEHLAQVLPGLSAQEIDGLIQRATDELADESLAKFINSRLQIEGQLLKKEGKQVNVGDLSLRCSKAFQAKPSKYRCGKKILKRLRNIIQTEKKQNADLIFASPAVLVPELSKLFTQTA